MQALVLTQETPSSGPPRPERLFLPQRAVEMWVSVLIEVPSTSAELALRLQNVFSNHLRGSGYSSLSRPDLQRPVGLQRCSFQIQSGMCDFRSWPQQARTRPLRMTSQSAGVAGSE